ncbi:hypothetical protein [Craterilacuibacter sp.]|uniref:hypothetical protein n=1 Tax=Craterilacuibacter sp. TaxID=2870909 RepID=UPI003F2A0D0D
MRAQDKRLQHTDARAVCPTQNPNRTTLSPIAPSFALRSPSFRRRPTLAAPEHNEPEASR